MFINAASTISYQPTFRNPGFSKELGPLRDEQELITPDYSEFIPAMDRRRMSQVQKMSITCAMDCLKQAQIDQPDGIIVGTSMGCSVNVKTFLDKILDAKEGPLSPTSFIVSTHNTVAGQIALMLKNHGYNMTYTQNTLSFEQGLLDAILCCNDGLTNVLVGGTDEEEGSIYNMKARLKNDKFVLTSGASFFIVSGTKKEIAIRLVDVGSFGLVKNSSETLQMFLKANHTTAQEIDLVLFASSDERKMSELENIFGPDKLIDYQKITGTYYTNSAFAMHYSMDILSNEPHPIFGEKVKTVLVYNNLIPGNLGLILLTKN